MYLDYVENVKLQSFEVVTCHILSRICRLINEWRIHVNTFLLSTAVCSAYPNMKRSSEVVQIGLNETNVFQTKFSATTLGSEQGLFFVLDEDDLDYR